MTHSAHTTHAAEAPPRSHVPTSVAAVLDAVLIVVFAAIGRQAHGEAWSGAFTTAAPFLVGGTLGWVIWWALRRQAPDSVAAGVVVWLSTVAGGMILRQLTGQGTHWSFVIVSLVATAVFLLGWRGIAALLRRRGHGA